MLNSASSEKFNDTNKSKRKIDFYQKIDFLKLLNSKILKKEINSRRQYECVKLKKT